MRTKWIAAGVSSLVAGAALGQSIVGTGAPAGTTWFIPSGLSADGLVMVGNASNGHGYRWTVAGGFEDMGLPSAGTTVLVEGVSADGTVVCGRFYQPGLNARAFRWTTEGVYQNLGVLGGGTFSYGYAVSGDGAVVVGQGSDSSSLYKATRWTSSQGLRALTNFAGVISDSSAYGANSDGSVVVGQTFIGGATPGYRAFRWTSAGMTSLAPLSGFAHSKAMRVSADGSTIAGVSSLSFNSTERMVLWVGGSVIELEMPEGWTESQPSCISADGSAIGMLGRIQGDPRAAMWTAPSGIVNLNTYLPTIGVDLTGWTLTRTYGMSGDGRTLVGEGGLLGQGQGWMVMLPCVVPPGVIDQPDPRAVCAGSDAVFTVGVSGVGPYEYVWSWQPRDAGISEWSVVVPGHNHDTIGAGIAFDATDTDKASVLLSSIAGAPGSAFRLRCEISNACGSTTSVGAMVSVCISDYNCDGGVDGDDIIDFFGAWDNNDGSADVNGDGGVDSDDVIVFFARWDAGC